MNSTIVRQGERVVDVGIREYRAISKAGVIAAVLGLTAPAAILSPLLLVLPVFGLLSGFISVYQIRRCRHELAGLKIGYFAIGISGIFLMIGSGLHAFGYVTEFPGHARPVTFSELAADERPNQPRIPLTSLQIDGQRIFIKGYVWPRQSEMSEMSDGFFLVPSLDSLSSFGAHPKLTHMIDVRLSENLKIKYSYRKRSLAGILRVDPSPKSADGLQGACYYLEADYLK